MVWMARAKSRLSVCNTQWSSGMMPQSRRQGGHWRASGALSWGKPDRMWSQAGHCQKRWSGVSAGAAGQWVQEAEVERQARWRRSSVQTAPVRTERMVPLRRGPPWLVFQAWLVAARSNGLSHPCISGRRRAADSKRRWRSAPRTRWAHWGSGTVRRLRVVSGVVTVQGAVHRHWSWAKARKASRNGPHAAGSRVPRR